MDAQTTSMGMSRARVLGWRGVGACAEVVGDLTCACTTVTRARSRIPRLTVSIRAAAILFRRRIEIVDSVRARSRDARPTAGRERLLLASTPLCLG
jgi:hypothetical protein